jgi:hypothetical protein
MSGESSPSGSQTLRRTLLIVLTTAATAALIAAPLTRAGSSAARCGEAAYSYAGVAGRQSVRGLAATIQLQAQPTVEHGHVAAWVGVGGVGMGPAGTDEWLQIGLAAMPGSNNVLYYEVARPHVAPRYVEVRKRIAISETHRVAVIETRLRANWWRVWVDGVAVSPAIFLPSSHDRWPPVATSESWNGGVVSCNAFAYRFAGIRVRHAAWGPLANAYRLDAPGYRLVRLSQANVLAIGGARPSETPPPPAPVPTAPEPPAGDVPPADLTPAENVEPPATGPTNTPA